MSLVTNVRWTCPHCETDNRSQLDGWHYPESEGGSDNEPLTRFEIPIGADLKWNPPCTGCRKYRLSEPKGICEFPIERINDEP